MAVDAAMCGAYAIVFHSGCEAGIHKAVFAALPFIIVDVVGEDDVSVEPYLGL